MVSLPAECWAGGTGIVLTSAPGLAAIVLMGFVWVIVGAINIVFALRKSPHQQPPSLSPG